MGDVIDTRRGTSNIASVFFSFLIRPRRPFHNRSEVQLQFTVRDWV
jgi:hypothetical protein